MSHNLSTQVIGIALAFSSCPKRTCDFNKSAELPTGRTVAVELLPKVPGEFAFACPMGMFRGRLIVE